MSKAEGGDEIIASLKRISDGIKPALKDAMEESLEIGETISTSVVPVKTGALRDSIRHEVNETENGVEGILSANTDYAKVVEFGTSTRPEKPYLRPGSEAAFEALHNKIKEKLDELMG